MKRIGWLLLLPVFILTLFTTSNAQAQARAGWSPQAKGAALGGAAGILGGVLVNGRNRKVGALIGGLGGAAAGYGVGKIIDGKQKKKAAALAAERAAAQRQEEAATAAANAAAANREAAEAKATAATHAAAARTAEERAAADRERLAADRLAAQRASTTRATTAVAATAAATTALVAANTEPTVADGYLPNPNYGVAGSAYPFSKVLRKSW